mmetsp:Transcript_35301/g.85612  ORF Transcript_35301/g.85612 Transcript_35301/m.85612 type:complete len:82 (-) Transcript_35301:910-1155(-)
MKAITDDDICVSDNVYVMRDGCDSANSEFMIGEEDMRLSFLRQPSRSDGKTSEESSEFRLCRIGIQKKKDENTSSLITCNQ